jgi:hypothetical protein
MSGFEARSARTSTTVGARSARTSTTDSVVEVRGAPATSLETTSRGAVCSDPAQGYVETAVVQRSERPIVTWEVSA